MRYPVVFGPGETADNISFAGCFIALSLFGSGDCFVSPFNDGESTKRFMQPGRVLISARNSELAEGTCFV